MDGPHSLRSRTRRTAITLWILAFLLMASAAVYQRLTGPTHPERGHVELAGVSARYRLPRNGTTPRDRRVEIPAPGTEASATLWSRRFPAREPFAAQDMMVENGRLVGHLAAQPAAGKIEYYVEVRAGAAIQRLPEGERTVVLRFKDPVPLPLLLTHVAVMFLSMWVGVRAALAAAAGHRELRPLAWITLGGLSIGGMVLGPVVQKFAFGALWTGWPFGYDLTDNKTLIMWMVWLIAALVVGRRPRRDERAARCAVLVAAVVMIAVYLVPHSLGGSELDYEALGQGVDPREAIRTGRTPD